MDSIFLCHVLNADDNSHSSFTVGQTSGSVDFNGVLDRETQRTWAVLISVRFCLRTRTHKPSFLLRCFFHNTAMFYIENSDRCTL